MNAKQKSPGTGVKITWPKADTNWPTSIKRLYNSFKNSEYSEFFYQTDIEMLHIVATEHANYIYGAEPNAAVLKTLFNQWASFGTTVRDRANINLVVKQVDVLEDTTNYEETIRKAMGL